MRILFVTHAWPPEGRGGTEIHAQSLAGQLSARGHQVGVFTRFGDAEVEPYAVRTGQQGPIGITRINHLFDDSHSLEWIYKNRRVHEAFEREVDEFVPDLVHVHHLTGLSTTIVESLKARGIPVVMTLHDFWMVCPRGQRMRRSLEICEDVQRETCFTCLSGMWPHLFRDHDEDPSIVDIRGRLAPKSLAEWDRHMVYVLDLCDLLICPSEFHRERMLDFPLDPERILAVPHGLDTSPFAGMRRRDRKPRRIGFIGSVIPVKGVHVLIDAFLRLGEPDLRLEIHGQIPPFHEDETYGERLREQAAGHPEVTLHGTYDAEDVPRILSGIDILVVPSLWWETFCLTIREGILAGIPVVASDIGAMREALDGEQAGLLFRAGDAEDLKRKLQRLIEDDALRERLSNQQPRVRSIEDYAAGLEGIYSRAAALSAERGDGLVVAPPSFPEPPQIPAATAPVTPVSLDWESVRITSRQEGDGKVSWRTRLPEEGAPRLELDIRMEDEDGDSSSLAFTVDLAGLEGPTEEAATSLEPLRPRRRPRPPLPERPKGLRREAPSVPARTRRVAVRRIAEVERTDVPRQERLTRRHGARPGILRERLREARSRD